MWVISKRSLHIQNPQTEERLDFTQDMVDQEVPLECEANSFFASYLETEEKPNAPLIQLFDDKKANDKLVEYVANRQKEIDEIKAEKQALLDKGGLDAMEGRKIVIPILPNLFRKPQDKPKGRPKVKK
jgi:hypothetical protein